MRIAGIILAAGAGKRAESEIAKQLVTLGGRPLLSWSLAVFSIHNLISHIVLVVPAGDEETYRQAFPEADRIVAGGPTRSASVLAGLESLGSDSKSDFSHVMIHDAARPGVTSDIINRLVKALERYDGAAPALPVSDALKRKTGQSLVNVDRSALWRIQTPQAFRMSTILSALRDGGGDYVDDFAAAEHVGARLGLIEGQETLGKVTYPEDFNHMERLLRPVAAPRIGTGFDVHALVEGDGLVLCGLPVPHTHTLKGHSDADVAWHALTDAILGALSLGDIGDFFPPSEPQWAGANSEIFLQAAVQHAQEAGFVVGNCDITIICELPKIGPHKQAMKERTSQVLGIPADRISVKATTTEQLGFTGRGEGIAAQAAVVMVQAGP